MRTRKSLNRKVYINEENKILIGVISIMFAGIITLGIIECNNSNTKDNNKLFIGNGKFCQAKG